MTDDRTPRIRRRLKKLGLPDLQIASNARTKKELVRAEAVVDKLIADQQVGVLRALMEKDPERRVALAALVDLDRAGKLSGGGILGTVAMRERLTDAVTRFMGGEGATAKRYRVAFLALRRKAALADDARLADLATVNWDRLSKRWGATGDDWENMRRAVSRLLSLALGDKYHTVRREIMGKVPHQATQKRASELTPDLFDLVLGAAREDMRPAFMTLLLTGMRANEYLACRRTHLKPHTLAVKVPGTKTKGSAAEVRVDASDWPWIAAGIPAPVRGYRALRKQWCRACAAAGIATFREWIEVAEDGRRLEKEQYEGPGLHALRHAHGQWAADAGIPLTQIKSSMRHATLAMTVRYAEHAGKGEVARSLSRTLESGRQARGDSPKPGRTASVSRQTTPKTGTAKRAAK